MTDAAVPATDIEAPAEAPASFSSEQINEFIRQGVQEAFDSRIPGLMSTSDKKVAQLQKQLETLARSSLSEDELGEVEDAKAQAELAEARTRVAALEAARKYPKGFDVYEQIMQQESAEDQMAFLEKFALAGADAQGETTQGEATPAGGTPPAEPEVTPPIDRNNPPSQGPISGIQNEEQAMAILEQYTQWPGEDFGG